MDTSSNLDRSVWTLFGLPLDATTTSASARHVERCAREGRRCFLSTPNLNFLSGSLSDAPFKQSVLDSDWVVADGMPLIWIGRFLGLPLPERVAGSDIFLSIQRHHNEEPLKIFFFGGEPGVAEKASEVLVNEKSGVTCVGFHDPGFVRVEDMSDQAVIDKINNSGAQFLLLALGAFKGQAWTMHNIDRLTVPVVSHLGAVINFVAGTVARAPSWIQAIGAEWIWRTYEEPRLFKRYWADGLGFLKLIINDALPLWRQRRRWRKKMLGGYTSHVESIRDGDGAEIELQGVFHAGNSEFLRNALKLALAQGIPTKVNLAACEYVDLAVIGLFQLAESSFRRAGCSLSFVSPGGEVMKTFIHAKVEYLLGGDIR